MCAADFVMSLRTPKLMVPKDFEPTLPHERGWLIPPFGKNPLWTYPAAVLPALLGTILIFMDQQITAVIINRKEHKLKVILNLTLFVLSWYEIWNPITERLWVPLGLMRVVCPHCYMLNTRNSMVCCGHCVVYEPCKFIESWIWECCAWRKAAISWSPWAESNAHFDLPIDWIVCNNNSHLEAYSYAWYV